MCPALMFAASRKDRVNGRTATLVVSINTRNGFNQSGAPSGRKCAIVFLGLSMSLDMINLNHTGNPIVSVNIRCLDVLNVYGISPIRLIIIKVMKIEEMINVVPLIRVLDVRASCVKMVDVIGNFDLDRGFDSNQNDD